MNDQLKPSVMFVAGDPSGDEHASHILRRLAPAASGISAFGIGGPAMQAVSFEALLPFEAFNTMGLWEVLKHLPFFLSAKKLLIEAMDKRKPAALVCVDYPGLNIPLMKAARTRNIPVVWYIVPQVWAWKKKRAAVLGANASFIGTVFPFEVDYFKKFVAPVSFVGHPLVEALQKRAKDVDRPKTKADEGEFRLSLIPGSRRQEVAAILPSMLQAALELKRRYPQVNLFVSKCRGLPQSLFDACTKETGITLVEGPLSDLLDRTDAALVTSGTATLETALAGVPLAIVYRTSAVTYWLLKRMISIPYIGLPNIVAGERIVPECIQAQACAAGLAAAIQPFIESQELRQATVEKLRGLKNLLGSKQPSREIAGVIEAIVKKHL